MEQTTMTYEDNVCENCDGTGSVQVKGCCGQTSAQGECCGMVGYYSMVCPECRGTGERV